MSDNNFINQYFDNAKKIHDLCIDDLGLSVDDARLYVYIYVQSIEKNGLNYFSQEDPVAVESLNHIIKMMGQKNELSDRLKIHTDRKYASEKISFYINNIMLQIK